MYAVISPSEESAPASGAAPLRRWADGAAEVTFAQVDGETRLRHLYQSDPCRVLFPRQADGAPKEAVIVTTSGGVVGGDRLRFEIGATAGCVATVTTQAAEKIYRAAGADSEIDVSVSARDCGFLEWMPQETILFDGSRLRRRTRLDLHGTARVLAGEIVVFGRRARDEKFTYGFLHDDWRVFQDGGLVWADALHLSSDIGARVANVHAFDGAAAVATVLYCAPDAAAYLETARGLIGEGGASCVDGILVIRLVNADAAALRAEFAQFWKMFRHETAGLPATLPRVWEV
ncbi:MAG: urease accessory protein [Paracoccaceae bacterium]|jgi:urease accessory protein